MKWGELQSNKRKPIVPLSGPMNPVLDRLLAQHEGRYFLRAEGRPLAEGSRNWTQMIHRLVARAGIDDGLAKGQAGVISCSIRHTFGDFFSARVLDFSIPAVLGHTLIIMSERDRLLARGSLSSEIHECTQLQ